MPDSQAQASARSLEGGSYEVIRKRLLERAAELGNQAEALNSRRKQLFGGSELALIATERVRTENNCVPRDVVSVGGSMLFGFEVFIGLKSETRVSDVLSLYRFEKLEGGYDLSPAPFEGPSAFLADPEFDKQFRDSFRYAKEARLLQLVRTETRLLVVLQIGASVADHKVLRFSIDGKGTIAFIDARGEEDYKAPRPHAFEWTLTTRENHVAGPHPHVNVLNEVFVETVGGDLTIKVENNTQDGLGVYREAVEDPNQTLDDGEVAYAKVAGLILLRVKPFREKGPRYLIFNPRNQHVLRVDALGAACVALPDDHGVIFPGGYYLSSGEHKLFDGEASGIELETVVPSPNGEDVLYVFYRPLEGEYLLYPYNLIEKEVKNAIRCHGYSLFADGTMLVFRAQEEPTRVHPVQIWRTPFTTSEFAASAPRDGSYLAKVGNADLVAGISELFSIKKLINADGPTRRTYEELISALRRVVDKHYWLGNDEAFGLLGIVRELIKTCELVVDEFEKQLALERTAREAVDKAGQAQKALLEKVRPTELRSVEDFLSSLSQLKHQRGHLISLKDLRAVDVAAIERLEREIAESFTDVSRACVDFFLAENAFQPLLDRLEKLLASVGDVQKTADLAPAQKELDAVHEGLTLLSETIGNLPIEDPTVRTKILDGTSSAFAQQNRTRAVLDARRKELAAHEGRAEFGVEFKLLGQSVTSALALSTTPEACDEQLAKLLLRLEGLEARFGELEEFSSKLAEKREELMDAVSTRRTQLVEERQRRAQNLASAGQRILSGVARRVQTLTSADELNAYFASDAMVQKLDELTEKLRELGDSVRADELEAKLKSEKQNALRALRDREDLLEDGGNVIRFGKHRFSVNTRPLELAIVPREGGLNTHLTGTDFFEPLSSPELDSAKELWEQELVSETPQIYRGEFLAVSLFLDAEAGRAGTSLEDLRRALREERLDALVREAATQRFDEGYERGVHDVDATAILSRVLESERDAGVLRYSPRARAAAWLFWQGLPRERRELVQKQAESAVRLRARLGDHSAEFELARTLASGLADELHVLGLEGEISVAPFAARYLVREVGEESPRFHESGHAEELRASFVSHLDESGALRGFEGDLRSLSKHRRERLAVALGYFDAFARRAGRGGAERLEIAARLVCEGDLTFAVETQKTESRVENLLGSHPRIQQRVLEFELGELLERVGRYIEAWAPRFRAYRTLRAELAQRERERLRLSEFMPRVLTSFVRNRLIDEVYLPLVGTNLAKQLGAAGANKRTDQMGLLLLVSPPGYGKTTLMEYVASKLGLVFMKVNGPALGADVHSLDPSEAPNATARQEVEKVNLALEMGNNVMLYLDDIQHTSPELLQKFISLCDAQRRIEGVWRGKTRTYDLRGKKFCVVMAGNPYTESGARFQIPDMLANRADTYNLGDILDGKQEAFARSYLENALTSHPLLAPLAGRDPGDVHKLIAMAQGEPVTLGELSHSYSSAEAQEIVALLSRALKVQRVLLRVNQEYIASASRDDRYRNEPPFKLQGSYRNMNKLVEKLAPVMNDDELERLIDDHYVSEAQTLTQGAEQNLLKLGELRGRLGPDQAKRWEQIKQGFLRVQRMGGKDDDPVARVTGTLSGLDTQLQGIREALVSAARAESEKPLPAPAVENPPTRVEVRLDGERDAALVRLVAQQGELLKYALDAIARVGAARSPNGEFAEIKDAIVRLGEKLQHGVAGVRRVDVDLAPSGPSNFYRPISSEDVCRDGGLFVATYEKPPPLGADVLVSVVFPTGPRCEFSGSVAWCRDYLGDHAPAGFGVRFLELSDDARSLIHGYTDEREPMLWDD
ncbi:MAG TPA: DNA repair ATPase [Polyangiaceae bacterium]|nr:DNA repair ATPase [Polyangiaceae bacterium]